MYLNISATSFLLLLLASGCNSPEITRLQMENDSLRNELDSQQTAMEGLREIGMWLDSIDSGRSLPLTDFKEEASQDGFSTRLRDINEFVKRSEEKILVIQNALKSSNLESSAYLMLVDAFKSEVQLRVDELIKLNEQITIYQDENAGLEETIQVRENEVNEISRLASIKEQELLLLETRIEAMVDHFKITEGDAYYARAKAVEQMARRTKLAPYKKRETYKEAVELYKKALALGKSQAKGDLARLENFK